MPPFGLWASMIRQKEFEVVHTSFLPLWKAASRLERMESGACSSRMGGDEECRYISDFAISHPLATNSLLVLIKYHMLLCSSCCRQRKKCM